MKIRLVQILTFLFLAVVILPEAGVRAQRPATQVDPDAGKVVVYRDEYGVPHIYAPAGEGGAYAIGWTQAEDRLDEMLKNFLRGTGEMAAAFGPAEFNGDLQARLWQHHDIAKKNLHRVRPEVRRHLAAFVRGVNDYLASHKNEIPHGGVTARLTLRCRLPTAATLCGAGPRDRRWETCGPAA